MKFVQPSIRETAFNCPHCHTLTTQYWHSVHVFELEKGETPKTFSREDFEKFNFSEVPEESRDKLKIILEKRADGTPYINKKYVNGDGVVPNLSISKCYECSKIGIWIVDSLIYPSEGHAPIANPDMPDLVRNDYEEASKIVFLSPRGASALLRLAVQNLCIELGQKGKNLDNDIQALVDAGLDKKVQMSLDYVRVIGNNCVHPGRLDLKDDRDTALTLFKLLNIIVEKTITDEKQIEELYSSLPEEKLKAIEDRSKKKRH